MSLRRTLGALAALSALVVSGVVAVQSPAGSHLTAIGLSNGSTSEFSFVLTRPRVPPGPALIQYTNTGEDPHDVRLQRKGSARVLELPVTDSGGVNSFPVMKLRRDSKYILWCSLDGHRDSGMEAALRVKKRR